MPTSTKIEVRAKTEKGYRAIGQHFPPIDWTPVEATEEQLAQLAMEPFQFLEYRLEGGAVFTNQQPGVKMELGKQEPVAAVTLEGKAVDPYDPKSADAVEVAVNTGKQNRRLDDAHPPPACHLLGERDRCVR